MTQSTSSDNPHEPALKLCRHIFGGERGLLAIWTGKRDADGTIPENTSKTRFFNYPAKANDAVAWAFDESDREREAYFCAHLLQPIDGKIRRKKEYAAPVIALWGDLDGAPVPNGELNPTAEVESSPGHYHIYWRLTDAIPPEAAERLNKRLAREIGADPSGFDLSQLFRVPGTKNHKYKARPLVRTLALDGNRTYSPGDLDRLLPELEEPEAELEHDDDEPPVALTTDALRVWRGEAPKLKDDGTIDRSGSLVKIGRELYDAGATRTTTIEGVRQQDATLGWRCYTDRPDAHKQYAAIWKLLKKEGRTPHRKGVFGEESRSRSRKDRDGRTEGVKNPKNSLRAVSFAGKSKPPPRRFVVDGIVPAGASTIVYGPSGIAKSFNILHLSLSVAFIGIETWHERPIMTLPVIYLDFEMEEEEQLRRAQEVVRGVGWPDVPRNFWYVNARGHSTAEVFDFAVEQLQDLDEALVVVDSFGFALAGESERSADVLAFMREQVGAVQAAGGHPLLVDHVARLVRGERSGNQDAFGSIYKKNAARSNIHVTGHQEEGSSEVYTTFTQKNTNLGPIAPAFTVVTKFASAEVSFELSDEVIRPPQPESTADLIIAAIEEHGPMTNKEIAHTIDRPLKTVQNITRELKDGGVLAATDGKRDGAPILALAGAS